jgi:hypothetical protein
VREAVEKIDATVSNIASKVNKDMILGVLIALLVIHHARETVHFAKYFVKKHESEAE